MRRAFSDLCLWFCLPALFLAACVETEIVPEVLEPKLQVEPSNVSLMVGQTFQLNGQYTDEKGEDKSSLLQWSSTAPAIASVGETGLLTALAAGQSWVIAEVPARLADSTLVTVVLDPNMVGKVEIIAAQTSIAVGATLQLQARVLNGAGNELTGKTITWASSQPAILSVNNSGLATGLSAGAATVTATVEGINSLPLSIQVTPVGGLTRSGMFSGNAGYNVSGTATLRQNGNTLSLVLESDFQSSNGPGLGVFLAKTASGGLNSQNSINLGNLQSTSGRQEYAVPAGTTITEFNYVVIYCIPFNVRFGTASLQ